MSQILSNLILVELRKTNSSPAITKQQRQLANAIASAVQDYINNNVVVVNAVPVTAAAPVKPLAP